MWVYKGREVVLSVFQSLEQPMGGLAFLVGVSPAFLVGVSPDVGRVSAVPLYYNVILLISRTVSWSHNTVENFLKFMLTLNICLLCFH